MAKEMIQTSVRQQSDVSAAMAVRLNRVTADRLWQEQAQWRHHHYPTEWRAFPIPVPMNEHGSSESVRGEGA